MDFIREILKEPEFKKPEKLKNLNVKTFQESDYDDLTSLYKKVFPDLKLNNFIFWKNQANPFGRGDKFTFLLEHKSQIIAQYTVVPKIFYFYGREYKCVQSMGTMTLPDYQGMGISTYLARLTYEYAKRKGYYFVYGFPNKNSIYLFEKKLGWINFGKRELFFKDIAHKTNSENTEPQYRITKINVFDEKINDLSRKLKNFFPIILKKDMNYLNWRFFEHPFFKYEVFIICQNEDDEIVSYFVLKKYKDDEGNIIGHIVDFLIDPRENSLEKRLFKLIEDFSIKYFKNEASKISFWLPNDNLKEFVRDRLGYNSSEIDTYCGFKIFKENALLTNLNKLRNWNLTMGDSDAF